MDFAEFLRWEGATRDSIDVKKMYIDMAGDLIAGILLSQIVFWHLPDRKGKSKLRVEQNDCLWLVKKREDWWDEVRITPKQFDRSIKILRDEGIVITEIHKYNNSPTIHIRINEDEFLQRVNLKLTKREFQNLPKGNPKIDERGKTLTKNTSETTAENTTTTTPESLSFSCQKGEHGKSLSYFLPVTGEEAEKLATDVLQFQVSQSTLIESPHRYLFSLIRKAEKGTLVIPDGYVFPEERAMIEEHRREAEAERLAKEKTKQEQLQKERKHQEELLQKFKLFDDNEQEKFISQAKEELGEDLPRFLLRMRAARIAEDIKTTAGQLD